VVIPVAVAGMLVVTAGGVGAYAAVRGPAGSYRTAVAGERSVTATLSATGTVGPASSATVAFPIAGTVDSVPVAVGDAVAANATLATLDPTALTSALNRAQSSLAQAKLTLEQDQDGTGTGTAVAQFTTVAFFTATRVPGTGLTVPAAQRAVQEAQQRADAALSTADGDLDAATAACSQKQDWSGALGFTAPTPSATPSAAPSAQPTPTGTPSAPSGGDSAACLAALQKVLADQTATQRAQQDVSAAQKALTAALADEAKTTPAPSPSGPGAGGSKAGTGAAGRSGGSGSAAGGTAGSGSRSGSGSGSGSRSGSGSGSRSGSGSGSRSGSGGAAGTGSTGGTGVAGRGGSGGTSSRPVTPEQITADQAAVNAAAAQVAVAQQNLAAATIRSPIAGTVAAVDIQPGDTVSADSSTATIEVIGAGPQVVTVSVDVTKIPSIRTGQPAAVVPDGGTGMLPASVTSVGVAPTTTGGTAYPVTLSFTGTPPNVRDGIGAAVTITTARATNALAVPTTAVTRTAAGDIVTVLADGKLRRTPVRVGAVGTDYTQITQGITAGTTVVLADLDEAVPSSSTTTRFGPRAGTFTRPGG
jgi:multidrug efflux pump subunit AcrA (membrane-fusion protein)